MAGGAVLFVCTANRCRSPLAMALLQKLVSGEVVSREKQGGHWRIESAGLFAIPDLPATEFVQRVAFDASIDLSQHRSRSIDQVTLSEYDLVLTMEIIQAEALASAFPLQRSTIVPFGSLVNLQVDIEDPTGYGLREHRALMGLLQRYLQAGWPRLQQLVAQRGT